MFLLKALPRKAYQKEGKIHAFGRLFPGLTSHMPVLAKMINSVLESILSAPTNTPKLLGCLSSPVVPELNANMRTLGMWKAPNINQCHYTNLHTC